ncbi:MAG: hypothetical protein RLZZ383_2363 [Pseudomonadota bacterium]|jgi:biopolymer transport protein ExbB/biopolymer transport protein TolQ
MPVVESLLQVARLGSAWVLWLLIALSVLSLATVAERLWFFQANRRRGGDALRDRVLAALDADDLAGARAALRESGTVEGQVVAEAFRFAEGGPAAFEAALDAELARARHALDRGLNLLGTIGNNAPFIGLLGTVIGVIVAFEALSGDAAQSGDMASVMAGIAEALVATGVGLFVAIPAVIAYNAVQARVEAIEAAASSLGRLVVAALQARAHAQRGRGEG